MSPNKRLKQFWTKTITHHCGTLQGINISHLGKRKIIFKMPFFGGYVSSLEGNPWITNRHVTRTFLVFKLSEPHHALGPSVRRRTDRDKMRIEVMIYITGLTSRSLFLHFFGEITSSSLYLHFISFFLKLGMVISFSLFYEVRVHQVESWSLIILSEIVQLYEYDFQKAFVNLNVNVATSHFENQLDHM